MPAPEPGPVLDLTAPRRIHIVGAGGAGMSAYAAILAEMGHRVSGSDIHEHPRLDRLRLLGVECLVPQVAENVPVDADAIVISSAVPRTNVEVRAAERAGIPVYSRADALAGIVDARRGLGVAGTHGKTTTTSMIALIMRAAGMHPSFLVGSELNEVGTNAGLDSGEWLIVESDESDGTFLRLALDAAIVTNIDHDHLWYWGDMERLEDAFRRFVDAVDGPVALCADDPGTRRLAADRPDAITYGWSDDARYRASDYQGGRGGCSFQLEREGEPLGRVRLPVVGRHNAQNAAGAAAMTLELGTTFEAVQHALAGFGGVARRFQHRGELDGVTMIDDYALLPPEIQATIRAASEGGWRRIIAVFQPFRYARTELMWREFAEAFVGADQVILTDVCGFHEQPIPGVTGHLILNAVLDAHPELPVAYFPHRAELVKVIPGYAREGDLVLTLGGGDITTLADDLLAEAHARGGGVIVPSAEGSLADELAAALEPALPGRVERDAPLAGLTTYRVGGPAAVLVRARREGDLAVVAAALTRHRPPLLILGRGSNLLIADRGFPGLALLLEGEFEEITPGEGMIRAGGAVGLPVLARRAAAAGLTGIEFYVGIPGTVGGAVRMNAGGHGRETVEVLTSARVVDLLGDGLGVDRSLDELALAYRTSSIGPHQVVVGATFRVEADTPEACEVRINDIVRWRREHQPGGANAGSVFRNPPGESAGALIDRLGLKDLRVGGAVVSSKHANFIQAEPGGTAADVRAVVREVQRRVLDATGVVLQPELHLVGFDDDVADASGEDDS